MNRIAGRCAAAVATAFVFSSASAQERAPRPPAEKQSREALRALPATNRVIVKFRDGLTVRGGPEGLTGLDGGRRAALEKALKAAGVDDPKIRRLHNRPEAELDAERAEGEAESGKSLADLKLYFVVTLPQGLNAADVADSLNALDFVEHATLAAVPAPPPVDIAPKTPRFTPRQGYRKDGTGVGALSADRYRGADGAGMRIVDLEYGWTFDHEDLNVPVNRITPALSDIDNPFGPDHGTAVLGIVSGEVNRYGVTGLAPAAALFLVAPNTFSGGYDPANAVAVAAGKLRRGDVLLIEQQYPACGSNTDFGPLEAFQPVYDAVETATARGIVVIAAAGNGALNLDAKACNGAFNRARRDSGAIIVGAGTAGGRRRLDFSTYGSRVDVQGWGENVATSGYGGLFQGGGDIRQSYTASFSGTSSATPILAGAVLQIQGVIRACGLKPLKGPAIRDLIVRTGAPQRGRGKIGPLPRILPALQDSIAKRCVANAAARVASAE